MSSPESAPLAFPPAEITAQPLERASFDNSDGRVEVVKDFVADWKAETAIEEPASTSIDEVPSTVTGIRVNMGGRTPEAAEHKESSELVTPAQLHLGETATASEGVVVPVPVEATPRDLIVVDTENLDSFMAHILAGGRYTADGEARTLEMSENGMYYFVKEDGTRGANIGSEGRLRQFFSNKLDVPGRFTY